MIKSGNQLRVWGQAVGPRCSSNGIMISRVGGIWRGLGVVMRYRNAATSQLIIAGIAVEYKGWGSSRKGEQVIWYSSSSPSWMKLLLSSLKGFEQQQGERACTTTTGAEA